MQQDAGKLGRWAVERVFSEVRYAWRQFARHRGFTVAVVLTIALGVGLNTAIFSVIRAVLLAPLRYGDPDRLVEWTGGATPIRYDAARAGERLYTGMGAWGGEENFAFSGEGAPEVLKGARVSANFLEILEVAPVIGRGFLPQEDKEGSPAVAMISTALWQRRFGASASVLGSVMMLNGTATTIVGVLPASFAFPREGEEVWVPQPEMWSAIDAVSRPISPILTIFGRLKPGVTVEQAREEMKVLRAAYAKEHPAMLDAAPRLRLGAAWDVRRMKDLLVEDARTKLWTLFGAVGLVLLIVCANVASLLLARTTARSREFAVRAAIGAGGGRIVAQLLTESLLLALMGGGLGIGLAAAGVELARGVTALGLPRMTEVHLDGAVLLYALAVSVATGLLFGLAPALTAMRPDLAQVLRGSGEGVTQGEARRGWFRVKPRSVLVAGQVALSTVLLIGAALLMESLAQVYRVDPGFEVPHLLTMHLNPAAARYDTDAKRSAFYKELVDAVDRLPGVESAAVTRSLPMTGWAGVPLAVEGRAAAKLNQRPIAVLQDVSSRYFSTMKIPLLRGRVFREQDDANAPPVAVINQAAAKLLWPGYQTGKNTAEDPVGQYVLIGGHSKPTQVVGIVGDVKESGLDAETRAGVYRAAWQMPPESAMVAVRTKVDPLALGNAVRQAVLGIDRDQPVSHLASMASVVDDSEGELRTMMVLLVAFAVAAGVIAMVGLYGAIAYSVAQRRREMGIRRALGASRADILRLVTGDGLRLGVAGVGLGLLGAYFVTRLMSGLLYGVTARDPWIYAGIAGLFLLVAAGASYLPASRAARVDPMESLRM
jgi:putative ABC transport system permease protein